MGLGDWVRVGMGVKVGGGGGVDKSERTVDVSARQCMFLLFFFFFLNITVERDIV